MTIDELIGNIDTLPPAPEVLPKLVKIMQDPDTDSNDVVQLIQTDPSIVTGVLRLSNSGAYSPASPVTDLHDAVSMLGIKEVYRIVNLVTSGEYLDGALPSMDIRKGGLWEHCLAVALIMDIIARDVSDMEGLPYTLGLLHDIGKLMIHLGAGEKYVDVFKTVETERMSICKAEEKSLGFDHAAAGAKVLEDWGFPEEVFIPIQYQYNPNDAPKYKELAGALHIANWASSVMGCNEGRDSWAIDMDNNAFQIDEVTIELAIIEAQERLAKAKAAIENN